MMRLIRKGHVEPLKTEAVPGIAKPPAPLSGKDRPEAATFMAGAWKNAKTAKAQAHALGGFIKEYIAGSQRLCSCKVLVMEDMEGLGRYTAHTAELRDNYSDKHPLLSLSIEKTKDENGIRFQFLGNMNGGEAKSGFVHVANEMADFLNNDLVPYLNKCPVRPNQVDKDAEQRERTLFALSRRFHSIKNARQFEEATEELFRMIRKEAERGPTGSKIGIAAGRPPSPKTTRQMAELKISCGEKAWAVIVEGKDYAGKEIGAGAMRRFYNYRKEGIKEGEGKEYWEIGPGSADFRFERATRQHVKDMLESVAIFLECL